MAVRYIQRIRADHSVALQLALTTPAAGIYLARVVTGNGPSAAAAWQLRLHSGHALGERGYPLPVARALAAQLAQLEVDWCADDYTLAVRFRDEPSLERRTRAILTQAAAAPLVEASVGGAA
ncbi:MAG: hypothetical protein DLM58_19160 [Pseudonocardiales bacterium]|nr:MAG: hypothetical protein DLM58_19160 [Pseudonocardiales bacterium]